MRLLTVLTLTSACACVTVPAESGSRGGTGQERPSASVGTSSSRAVAPCVISGCSGQVCASQPLFSSCEWRTEYACFASAICEPQEGGSCGWSMTDALTECLATAADGGR
jgi:hypothetical protein